MQTFQDGPSSPYFHPLILSGNTTLTSIDTSLISNEMAKVLNEAPGGTCTCWGIPFDIDRLALLVEEPLTLALEPIKAKWLVFMHTSDYVSTQISSSPLLISQKGQGEDREVAAYYTISYIDGSEEKVPICRHHQIGAFQRHWGINCYEAVPFQKPHPLRAHHEQMARDWGRSQTRVNRADMQLFTNWLWAWENPYPDKDISGLYFQPVKGVVIVSAVSYGNTATMPLRWRTRA